LTVASTTHGKGPVSLTMENHMTEMSGKNSFVKFQAPWWGHCKSMKPAWDQLGDEYAGSSSVLIGDVDCTAAGKELCDENGVSGYPTIKYYMEGETVGTDYSGGRSYEDFEAHVKNKLEKRCVIDDQLACDERQKGYIIKMMEKPDEEQTKQLKRLEKMGGESMAPANLQWLMQRLSILKQFVATHEEVSSATDEL